jgi:hypothetical protein
MNRAQKRIWLKLAVSVAGLLAMSGALALIKFNDLQIADKEDHTSLRVLGLLCTIPLILIVILDWGWKRKRIYDERDLHIERRSLIIGVLAVFFFLGGAAMILLVLRPLGSINVYFLPSLVYLAYFVLILVSSIAALIQYGRVGKDGEK